MGTEIGNGRDIAWTLRAKQAPEHILEAWIGTSWIVEVAARGTRDGKPFHATHSYQSTRRTSRCDTSLRITPEALLQLVRNRWSIEGWHWIRDTQLHGRPPLPRQWRRRDGHAANHRLEPVAPGWVPVNPFWIAGGDARDQNNVGNGDAPA